MVVNINCQLYFSCEFCDRRCQTILGQMLNAMAFNNTEKEKIISNAIYKVFKMVMTSDLQQTV